MDIEEIKDEIDKLNDILSLILNHIYRLQFYLKINKRQNTIEDNGE